MATIDQLLAPSVETRKAAREAWASPQAKLAAEEEGKAPEAVRLEAEKKRRAATAAEAAEAELRRREAAKAAFMKRSVVESAIRLASSRGPSALPPSSVNLAGHDVTDADLAKMAAGLTAGGSSLTGLDLSGAGEKTVYFQNDFSRMTFIGPKLAVLTLGAGINIYWTGLLLSAADGGGFVPFT